jgi:hypothetical protein
MEGGLTTMSMKEIDRLSLLRLIEEGRLSQIEAAKQLKISDRQMRRLYKNYCLKGKEGIISKKRGKSSSRKYSKTFQEHCLSFIKQDYYDYGPTLAAEKLQEYNGLKISKETARQWMIKSGIWIPKSNHETTIHQPRFRRSYYGELIQIDGSVHRWFEDRGPKVTLLVFIDDATSLIQKLLFVEAETTFGYLRILKDYLKSYGKPRAFYSDKHVVFKVNIPEAKTGTGLTQFGRVLNELGIESIFANSPQAKGRVERCNGTLQDRLVKELRYRNISDIASANEFLEGFRQRFNLKFAKVPKDIINVHRPLENHEWEKLEMLFTIQTPHKVTKNLIVRHKGTIYKLILPDKGRRLRQEGVLVCEDESGKITILYNHQALNYEVYRERIHDGQILSRKELETFLDKLREEEYTKASANDLIEFLSLALRQSQ